MDRIWNICSFEGTVPDKGSFLHISKLAWWLSWLERRPVTAEVMGSNPIRVVTTEYLMCIQV